MHATPDAEDQVSSEILPGEEFAVLEMSGRWAWGYSRHDHYVGYVEAAALTEAVPGSHLVAVASTSIRQKPDLHSPSLGELPMGARVGGDETGGFVAAGGGFVSAAQLLRMDAPERDPVAVAERLVGAPYLLGGRTARGIDCSALVQLALGLCGIRAPRDSDQQRVVGEPAPEGEPQRGDLIFFEGHVGLMMNAERMIHSTRHHGGVVVEPLAAVAARTPLLERRRLPG